MYPPQRGANLDIEALSGICGYVAVHVKDTKSID